MARTKPWKVSDEFWEKVEPLVPPAPSRAKGGRRRMDDRKAFAAIIYVLRTGIQWNALPREMGASSTVHDRYQEWERLGFFEELWRAGLAEYDELRGIEWEWQALDGAMTKAPLGRGAGSAGKNPTDRAKSGTKRSMLTDGAGIPLAVVVEGANRHDSKLLAATLDGLVVARPAPEKEEGADCYEQHLCLDAAYDSEPVREELEARNYEPHISPSDKKKRSERKGACRQPGRRARRWVVERTHSWLNRSRRLLVRWEKKTENYLAFVHLACAQLIFSKILVSG
ncbi:MAG: IS5 family transposase [Actinobacteria bacterium]|nr:IS5 family transposase [Actinomycetota bacterium]